jgi:hypothetical protein
VVRYLALIPLAVFFASGLVVLVDARAEPAVTATAVRGPDQILGAPLQPDHSRELRTLYRLQPLYLGNHSDLLQAGPEEEHSA